MNEKISIVVPIYNVENYLEECINSLINQTYNNIEIILINDGSKDKSINIIRKYEEKDKRIKVIDKKNEGVSMTRTLGIKESSGNYVTFLDPDDWIEINMIEVLYNTIKKSQADIVQCNSYYNKLDEQYERKAITRKEIEIKGEKIKNIQLSVLSPKFVEKENNLSLGPIRGVWGKLYKKEIISDLEFNSLLYAFEDGLFNLYALEKTNKIVFINEYLHHYRINSNSACNSYKKDWIEQNEKILKEIKKFIEIKKTNDKEFKKAYYVLACEFFSACLTRCIFHKDNKYSKKEKMKELKKYIISKMYLEVFINIDFKYLNIRQKLLIFLVKTKQIKLIELLYKLKQKGE